MNDLESFSNAIQKMGEEREARQQELLKALRDGMSQEKARIESLSHADLVDYVMSWYGTSDPREQELRVELRDHARSVLLRRLESWA